MPTKTTKRKGPIGHGMETVAQAGAYLDRQLGGMVGMNPERYTLWVHIQSGGKDIWKAWANGPKSKLETEAKTRGWLAEHTKILPKGQTPVKNPAKFERCVRDVEARGEDVNTYAVCTAAGTRNPSVMEFAKKDAAYAYARLMEAEGWAAKVVRRGFKWGVELVKGARNPKDAWVVVTSFTYARPSQILEFFSTRKQAEEFARAQYFTSGSEFRILKSADYKQEAEKTKKLYLAEVRKGNPEGAAAEMYESFHGQPSEEVTEFVEDLHYHENLAELGVLAGVVVETEYAGVMALAFSGYKWDNREGVFELKAGRENPLFGGLFGGKTTHYSVKHGTKTTTTGKLNYKGHQIVSIGGEFEVPSVDPESRFDSVKEAKRFIDEWSKNPGLPVYTVPMSQSHRVVQYGRGLVKLEAARREAKKIGSRFIVKVEDSTGAHVVYLTPDPRFTLEDLSAIPGARTRLSVQNPDPTNSDTTLLASNEKGTQLFLVGGDQSVDIDSFKLKGAEAEHESIVLGSVQQITYHTSKIFEGKREEFDYFHHFSEDTKGPLPTLRYDAVNEKLYLDGGCYKINKPWMSTSVGIED